MRKISMAVLGACLAITQARVAWASSRDFVAEAHQALAEAQDALRSAPLDCRKGATDKLERALAQFEEPGKLDAPERLRGAAQGVSDVAVTAVLASCPAEVTDRIREAADDLDRAYQVRSREVTPEAPASTALTSRRGPPPMSAQAFAQLLSGVKASKDEFQRGDLIKNAIGPVGVSGQQLLALLDQLDSDVVKLDVVTTVAPSVEHPEQAAALASHFDSPELAQQAADALAKH